MLFVCKRNKNRAKNIFSLRIFSILISLSILLTALPLNVFVLADSNSLDIKNADFSLLSEYGNLEGWTASGVNGSFGTFGQGNEDCYDGEYAKVSSSDGIWNMDTSVSSLIEIEKNTEYKISYYAKLDGDNSGLSAWYCEYKKDGSPTDKSWNLLDGTVLSGQAEWKKYSSAFKTSNEAEYIALRFSVNKGTAGIDKISIVKKAALKTGLLTLNNSNAVPNGGFEDGFNYWGNFSSGGASTTVSTDNVASGTKAVKMYLSTASQQGYLQSNQFDIESSQKYILSYKLKITPNGGGNGAQCYAVLYEFDGGGSASGGLISSTGRWNTLNGEYETVTYEFTTKSTTKKLRIDLMHNAVAGTSYWDDVTVVKAQSEPEPELSDNLLLNGGFESDFSKWNKQLSGGATAKIVTDEIAEGKKALQMYLPLGSAQCYLEGEQFALKPSTTYELSYKLKIVPNAGGGNGAQCYAYVYEFNEGGTPTGGLIGSTGRWNTVNGEYETVTYQFTTKETTKTARIDLLHNGVAGTSYWDDVTVAEVKKEPEPVSSDNLLLNGGFESDFSKWNKQLSGGATAKIVTDEIAEGKKALQMYLPLGSAQCYLEGEQFALKPSTAYELSYKLKIVPNAGGGNGAQCYAYVYEFNEGGTPTGGLIGSTGRWNTVNGEYETVTYQFTTKETTKTARIDLLHNGVAGTSYWDDITLKEVTEPVIDTAVIKNGDFSKGAENWTLNGKVSIQNKVAVENNALKIDDDNSVVTYAQSNFFDVVPNKVYIISYDINVTDVKDEDTGVNFSSFVCGDGYWVDFATSGVYRKTDGFEHIKTAITIPENIEHIAFGLKNYNGSGTAYIDNVVFTETDLDGTNPNLDFEADSEMVLNWNFSTDNGSIAAVEGKRDGSDGKTVAKIKNETDAGYSTLKTKQIPVKPDTLYQFSYWIKIDGTFTSGASLTFHQLTAQGTGASAIVSLENSDNIVNTDKGKANHQATSEFVHATWTYRASGDYDGWRNVTYSLKTASDAAFLETHISVTGGKCTAYIDDVSLTEVVEDPNLDFENVSEITGAPVNWYMSAYHQTAKGINYDDTVYHSGKRSMYVEKNSNLEKIFIQSPVKFSVNKNYIYEFSAFVAAKNASPDCTIRLDLVMYDENGEQIYNDVYGNLTNVYGELISLNGSKEMGQWKKIMTRSLPDSRASYASLSFTITHGSAEIWIDDVFFNVVDNDVDTIVDYSDFHAVDQNGNVSGWSVEGNGTLTTKSAPTEKNQNNRTAIFESNDSNSFMKRNVNFNETGYVYCVKGELAVNQNTTVQMRFFDYKGNEYKDKRVETTVNPAQKKFELNYTAPSCTTAEILIGGCNGTVEVDSVTFYQTGAPASKTQWTGKWVWYNEDPYQAQDNYRYFRYKFALEDNVSDAPFQITVDDKYALYVNGTEVTNNWDAGGDSWSNVTSLNLKQYLNKGANVIAIKAYNYVSEAGVLFDGKFTLNNKNTVSVYTTSESVVTTKTANDKTLDWTKTSFDDSKWLRTKEFGTPPCSPWGPVHYNSSLYIHNAAKIISTKTPDIVAAGGTMEFSLKLKLSSKMESEFTPKVTIWRKNSLLSLASSSIRFLDHKNVLDWPVGKEFTVKCEIDVPSYMDTGKYVLQMDENAVLLDGDDVFDNKFLNFNVEGDASGKKSLVSKIEQYNGTPTLMIDGEPYGSFFYLRPDLDVYLSTDAETRIYKSDLDLYITYGGSLYKGGANGSNPIWREDGTIDYDAFDSTIFDTLAANGSAYVMVNIGMFAPVWWLNSHPDDVALSLGTDGKQYPQSDVSMSSETFRKEAGGVLRKLIKHMKTQTYYNRVYGIKISGGQTYEWMNWGVGDKYGPDFSKASKEGFKKYLKNKYGTVEALRKAWGNNSVDFENAPSPTYYDMSYLNSENKSLYLGSIESGKFPQNMVDWNLWLSEAVTDSFLYYCKIAKEETDNNLIVGGYNGYIWTFNSYDAIGKSHTSFDRVLDSEYVDWIASPENYGERMLGESNTYMTMTGSVMSHGKIYIAEQDNRTCLSTTYASSWDGEWSFSTGVEHTLQNTIFAEKRDFAHALTDGSGEWLYDMYGGWLDDDQIYDFIKDSKAEFDFSLNIDKNNLNDVAVIVGDQSYAYMCADTKNNMQYTINYALLQIQRKHLAAMGAGYDTYVMSSFLDNKVPEHKVYIILSPTQIDAEMNEALNKYLKVNDHCVVWVYLPGISDGSGYNLDNVKSVTGFAIDAVEKQTSLQVEITDNNNPVTKGLKGVVYGDKTPLGISPVTYIKDTADVTVLGTNVELKKAGLGIKDMGSWTSIYSAAPCITVDVLRNILKMTGCHIYSESNGDIVYNNSNYVALHSSDSGEKTISLPENHSVYDVYEEKFVSMDTNKFTYYSEQNDTHIFRLLSSNKYAVTSRVKGGNGTVSKVGLTEVNPGDDFKLDISPDKGYEISSVTVNGEKVSVKSGKLELKNIKSNYSIVVKFSKIAKPHKKQTDDNGDEKPVNDGKKPATPVDNKTDNTPDNSSDDIYDNSEDDYSDDFSDNSSEEYGNDKKVPTYHEEKIERVEKEKVPVIGAVDIPLWVIILSVLLLSGGIGFLVFFIKKRKERENTER